MSQTHVYDRTPRRPEPPYVIQAQDRVLAIPEAALLAGVSVDTLRRVARRGELTILRLSPRRIGIRASELARWLASREVRA
jgi:excisionase family DNA binding protein